MVEVDVALRSVAVVSKDILVMSTVTLVMCGVLMLSARRIASTRLLEGSVRYPRFASSNPRNIASVMSGMLMVVTGQLMFAAVVNGELSYHHMSVYTIAATLFFIFTLTYIVAHEISASLLLMFGVLGIAFVHMNNPTVYSEGVEGPRIDPSVVGGDSELASELTSMGRLSKVIDTPTVSDNLELAIWVADVVGLALMMCVIYWIVVLVKLWIVNDLPIALKQVEDMGFSVPQGFVASLNKMGGVRGGGKAKRKPVKRVR